MPLLGSGSCDGAACEDRPTLLVLDNCEHVLEAAPLVADVLTSSTSLRLLATSRAPLRVRGEREYVVGPLALDAAADSLSQGDSTAENACCGDLFGLYRRDGAVSARPPVRVRTSN